MFKLISTKNNPNPSPLLIKTEQSVEIEPINAKRKEYDNHNQSIAATEAAKKKLKIANIESNINKLEDYLVFEKKKNHKQLNELVQLKFKVERQKQAENTLVKENNKHKEEIVELKRRLNDYQRLGDNFQRIKFDFLAPNKRLNQRSNDATRSNAIESTADQDLIIVSSNESSDEEMLPNKTNSHKKREKNINSIQIDFQVSLINNLRTHLMGDLKKELLNPPQKEEFDQIQAFFADLIMDRFNRRIRIGHFYRGKKAYHIYLNCIKHRCYFNCKVIVAIKSKQTILTYKRMCEHYSPDDDRKFIESLNFPVLKSLKQTNKGRALKLDMNQEQLNECNRIETYFKQFIIDQYNRRAKADYIIKSIKCGCIFYMRCVESECDCVWEMRINPRTKECSIISSKICGHLMNANKSADDNSTDSFDDLDGTSLEPGGCFIDKDKNIRLRTSRPLSLDIFSSHVINCINKTNQTEIQSNELDYIDSLMKDKLVEMGFKTNFNGVRKVDSCYVLRRKCNRKYCLGYWTMEIKVPIGYGIIRRVRFCDHEN